MIPLLRLLVCSGPVFTRKGRNAPFSLQPRRVCPRNLPENLHLLSHLPVSDNLPFVLYILSRSLVIRGFVRSALVDSTSSALISWRSLATLN